MYTFSHIIPWLFKISNLRGASKGESRYEGIFQDKKKGFNQEWLKPFFYISGGADGTRIRVRYKCSNAVAVAFSSVFSTLQRMTCLLYMFNRFNKSTQYE